HGRIEEIFRQGQYRLYIQGVHIRNRRWRYGDQGQQYEHHRDHAGRRGRHRFNDQNDQDKDHQLILFNLSGFMKKLLVFVFAVSLFGGGSALAQCNAETLSTKCIPKLAEGFNFLKSYKIEKGAKPYVEYSYVFTKGTQYMINICAGGQTPNGIVVSLFDS